VSEHDRWLHDVATYALGALPEDERAGFEAHLMGCPACRAELDELRVAAEALPVAAPPMRPPPALKARIMAEVEREAELLRSAGPAADRPAPAPAPRRRFAWPSFRFPTPAVAALACAALLIGLGVGAFLFGSSGGRTVDFQRSGTLSADASAELDVKGDSAVLVARGLPAPPAGRVYQVWLQRDGQAPEPTAALFTPRRDGSATANVGDVKGVAKVMVSSEPTGGSPMPTTAPILIATVA
jgi:anti-sigma factor RsiW